MQAPTKLTLIVSAVYLAAIGFALLVVPLKFGIGAVPSDASPALIALLRLLGGPFLGIAALNWLSRNEGGRGLRPVLIANLIGFGVVAANDIWGIATGEARQLAKFFVVFHLFFTLGFAIALRQETAAQR